VSIFSIGFGEAAPSMSDSSLYTSVSMCAACEFFSYSTLVTVYVCARVCVSIYVCVCLCVCVYMCVCVQSEDREGGEGCKCRRREERVGGVPVLNALLAPHYRRHYSTYHFNMKYVADRFCKIHNTDTCERISHNKKSYHLRGAGTGCFTVVYSRRGLQSLE
jgi:hypothetical protein